MLSLLVATALVVLPPVNAPADYQLGGSYQPGPGVEVVARDRAEVPASGLYNICYLNGFQAQPNELRWWKAHHRELLLRRGGRLVVDRDWNEVLLDSSTRSKRRSLAKIESRWLKGCAKAGFQAVEFDNLDSYTRSKRRLAARSNLKLARLLVRSAHNFGLAVAQKNTPQLAAKGRALGFDFVVAEQCQRYAECDRYSTVYGDHMIEIEYSPESFASACASRGSRISVVLRDRNLVGSDAPDHRYESC